MSVVVVCNLIQWPGGSHIYIYMPGPLAVSDFSGAMKEQCASSNHALNVFESKMCFDRPMVRSLQRADSIVTLQLSLDGLHLVEDSVCPRWYSLLHNG